MILLAPLSAIAPTSVVSPPLLVTSGDSIMMAESIDGGGNQSDDANVTIPAAIAMVPSWRVGDRWVYDATLDATSVVADTPDLDGATIGAITGQAMMEVTSIDIEDVEGVQTPMYTVEIVASVSGPGTFPEPNTGFLAPGTLLIDFSETRKQRVSDLSYVSVFRSLDLDFRFTILTIDIADFDDHRTYDPPRELYDFPMRPEDVWSMAYTETSQLSGDGGPMDLSPEPEIKERDTRSELASPSTPPVSHADCPEVGNLTTTEGDEVLESHWWCDAIAADLYWWTNEIGTEGIVGEFRLHSVERAAVTASTVEVVVTLNQTTTGVRSEFVANVILLDVANQSILSDDLILFHEGSNVTLEIESLNGVNVTLDAGNKMDWTPTEIDWASHGVVVCHGNETTGLDYCGVATITIEGSAVGEIIRRQAREGLLIRLDSILGHGEDATRVIRL